jgi:predicted extracellular nuclease
MRMRFLLVPALVSTAYLVSDWPGGVRAASTTLVIAEFRTRGPSGGNDEFIEIRNVSAGAISLNGWSIMGSNASGLTDTRANLANVTLGPGCAWLLGNSNTNGYTGPVDQTYAVGITDDGGIALTGPGGVADQVGLSAGSAFGEGARLPNFGSSNGNRSYERTKDSDSNAADFRLLSPSAPQTSGGGCNVQPTPTNPAVTGSASPDTVTAGGTTLLTAAVTPGTNPTSTGLGVTAATSAIGIAGNPAPGQRRQRGCHRW